MTILPSGTVTFLFTDIEGSTRLWEADADAMRIALVHHDELVTAAVSRHGGAVFKHTGDGMCAVFSSAPAALDAAVDAQQALEGHDWSGGPRLRARMGVHTGDAAPVGDDYFGTPLNRCARVMGSAHGGQIVCSATTAALTPDLVELSLRDLGLHRLRDLGEPQHLFQVVHPRLPSEFPPLRALDAHRHNLPVPRTTFVGRERELAQLRAALDQSRLVTVTGVGGSGKTRLALQAAGELVHLFADGVFVAELATVTDPAELEARVVEAVGVPLASAQAPVGSPAEVLLRYLEEKELLLILDNCEHLLDDCAELTDDVVTAAPRVTVLATSREPLGVAGERVLRIPSLALAAGDTSVESVASSEAGQLFVDRAALARPGFVIAPDNVKAVDQICRRLDGIPLAIELAAARLRHLSVHQIAERLDDRFKILTGGGRTALPRQQTLQATLDWSFDLLSDAEQRLFRRISVFVAAFPLDAIEGVCAGDGVERSDIVDLVGRLADRSLVVVEDDDRDTLYRLLETMRHFAQQKLVDAGEATDLRDRHRDWYAANVEVHEAFRAVYGIVPVKPHFEDNVRLALDWALNTADDAAAYRLMSSAAHTWSAIGLLDEASELIGQVLARPWTADVLNERAWLLTASAIYANLRNDFAAGLAHAKAAQVFADEHELVEVLPHILHSMAIASSVVQGIDEGERWMERAASKASELGFQNVTEMAWIQLAGLRLSHDPIGAREAAEHAVSVQHDVTPNERVYSLANLAFTRLVTGDLSGAGRALDELDQFAEARTFDAWGDIEGIVARAPVLAAVGRSEEARAALRAGLEEVTRLAVPLAQTAYVVGFAGIEAFGGDPAKALVLLGAARRRFDNERAWRAPVVGGVYVHSVAHARSLVSDQDAKAARAEGFELEGDAAFALVL